MYTKIAFFEENGVRRFGVFESESPLTEEDIIERLQSGKTRMEDIFIHNMPEAKNLDAPAPADVEVEVVNVYSRKTGDAICSGESVRDAIVNALREGISLEYAALAGQDLSDMDLTEADFSYACLANVDLSYANMTDVKLRDTDMFGAKVNGVIGLVLPR